MSATLNLTEVLSSLQDAMTKDGSISTGHRSFYTTFRGQIDAHPGTFLPTDIEILMENARREMAGEVSDEDYEGFVEAVLSKISIKERLEFKAKEDANARSEEEIAAMVKQAEEEARAKVQAEFRLKAAAEAAAKTPPAATPVAAPSAADVEAMVKEKAAKAAEEARKIAEQAATKAETESKEQLRKQ